MPSSSLSVVVQQLRAAGWDEAGQTDGELLTQFLSRRDGDALAALVERHAPMVWGVCCRLLCNPHDAEDAFQATFLVLVQKAATVVPREMVANWLYGVAQQTAVRLRALAAKRGRREVQMNEMPEPATAGARDEELLALLDQELSRLPERFRALIVLCDLEGNTRKDVALQLGCPEGTVASGLARARALLAKRLTRRGVAVSGGSLAATLSQSVASADVPRTAVTSAINVATLLVAGRTGAISGPVAALTHGVLKTMFLKKIMTTAVTVLALGAVVIAAGSLAGGQTEGTNKPVAVNDVKPPAAEKPMEPAAPQKQPRKDAEVAWGKEVGGLQAGLSVTNADDIRIGGKIMAVVQLRNVGTETITVSAWPLWRGYPGVTDARGNRVRKTTAPHPLFSITPKSLTLKPGETVTVGKTDLLVVTPDQKVKVPDGVVDLCAIHVEPGKYKANCIGFVKEHPALATGTIEFEVKPAKDEGPTWGQEVGGLQAGLGLPPGAKRVYRHGETVQLVVRVRNVGKETVTFQYVKQFLDEKRPTVTDPEGKNLPQAGTTMLGIHGPTEVALEPGKEIVLETRMHGASGSRYELIPANGERKAATKEWPLVVGTGKVGLQYNSVLGSSSSGKIKLDPALEKLATGTLELEVKEAPAEKPLTPEEATGMKEGSKLTVEFKVESVTKAVLIKSEAKQEGWIAGHGPDDRCLCPEHPKDKMKARFLAALTPNAIAQLNKVGILDIEKHFGGKTVRVTGSIVRWDYDGYGTPPQVEIVVNDLSQLEVVK